VIQTQVTIINKLGLHARAAAKFVGCASAFSSRIQAGRDGKLVARAKVPPQQPHMRYLDYATSSGNLTDTGGFDIVLREWRQDKGGGGVHLWAYDKGLEPLWHYELPGAWYGHHYAVQFYDVDGDGRDELLAGGTLFDAQGNVLWVHDGDREMQHVFGAEHYDAVAIGAFAADEEVDPVAFLLGGSAGVYVVDALTGKTRAGHRIGHAQGRFVGRMRADLPGELVPEFYYDYLRTGNAGFLKPIIDHNRQDVESLVNVFSSLVEHWTQRGT